MFDKLIESNSAGAEFKPRRKFFMVSSVVVGILFLSAVVFSLYAQDIDLGTDNFDMAELLAPVTTDAPEPEPPREQPQRSTQSENDLTTRRTNMARVDEATHVPDTISTTRNTEWVRPRGEFVIGDRDKDGSSRVENPGNSDATGSATPIALSEPDEVREPPPAPRKVESPKRPISIGVANGKAKYLPKPAYPPAALAIRAEGDVSVQVTIDEEGKVISAKAFSGHPTLRGVSEKAAWNARFTPTLLSNVPVKVTGVIVYKFSR